MTFIVLDVLTVIESRKLRLIAHLIEHLYPVNDLSRQVADSKCRIVAKKGFPSIKTRWTVSPFMDGTVLPTVMPGILVTNSSIVASGCV